MKLSTITNKFKILALAMAVMLMLTVSVSASANVLSLYKNKETDNARFKAEDMLPGDHYLYDDMEHLLHNYCVRVSYNGTITVHFKVDNIQTTSPAPSLADVLKCDIKIDGKLVHSGLLADVKDIPYTITGVKRTQDLNYEIGVYLDTSVGNDYQKKNLTADFVWWVETDDDDDDGGSGGGGGGGSLPSGPDTPVNPPVDPDNPDIPDGPDDPDAPDVPDLPDDPDSPHTPGTPGTDPNSPDAPGTIPGDEPSSPDDLPGKPAPDKPEKPKGELIKPPNTGDFKQPLIYITGICVATFILFILIFVRKKTKNETNRTIRRLMIALAVVVILAICLCVTTFALIYSISVDRNIFSTATVDINLNDEKPIIDGSDEFLFEPGMTVYKDFFIENEGTADVYYKIYFEDIDGDLADVLDVTISDRIDETSRDCVPENANVLYSGKLRDLTLDNTDVESDELAKGDRHDLYAIFHFPEDSRNNMQNEVLTFTMSAKATQKRNNPKREF